MNAADDPVGLAEGRTLLAQLPNLYFAALKSTQLERRGASEVQCSFELPFFGKRATIASNATEAIRSALNELTEIVMGMRCAVQQESDQEDWPSILSAPNTPPVESEREKAERFQAKERRFTIGVTLPVTLKDALQSVADRQSTSFADVARHLVGEGYENFEDRSFSEASERLLSSFVVEVSKWLPSDMEQVMVRLDPPLAVRLRSSAKEYRRSASEFGAMCMAQGFALQTQFVALQQKVEGLRGAALRKVAPQVGLGKQIALLSGILAGSISVPRKVLARLAGVLEASEAVLIEFFKRSFATRAVPAFKAVKGKPHVIQSATAWEDAVKSLNLPAEETRELIQLDE